ncbi:MAG: ATP-dependent metallopeptidase FtsH/Yme1/Tma family protein [Alphaproteobacteria bacterium]|nr:ATP-dependent metallopeptidase FtsH/Yme1/Tma family protein [Alphaproteobacteria bacterium]MBT5390148.1 ATP-dependent metallopeptidase FtsH/Yme1/Tma family protein [Alphaproteobacteria bacterium]MBT5654766.1 ATP-dependent metallopeptidase FtsH/Yme1/Tma family protein [Alphaproteobacteria bacterium]
MNNFNKNLILWLILGLFLIALFNIFQGGGQRTSSNTLAFSDFLNNVDRGNVQEVLIKGNTVTGKLSDGTQFATYTPNDPGLVDKLSKQDVKIMAAPLEEEVSIFQIFLSLLPVLLIVGVWAFFFKQMQGGGGKVMGFGRSRARLLSENKNRITFKDVAGIDEAKFELEEIVDFLKDPRKYERLGGRIPKGVLLVGPPGTGKTLLARAISGEANVPFFSISGSDFVEMFVGVGASRVRDMFEQAKKNAPCIVFIDEIDAVGRHRGAGLGGGNDEREQTLNQLLVEMDGFESNEGIILVAATNRPDVLDTALLRPGRFDRQVVVPSPDVAGREKILLVHMKKVKLAADVQPKVIARGTPGFSGADLENIVNEAALLAARKNKPTISMLDLEEAKDKVMMGAERRSMVMTEEEKKLTAYHEAGHALVGIHLPDSDPIHKATIVPRGRALGMVMRLPENDRISMPRSRLLADLAVAMGGRIAEELIFGKSKVTTGAASDIQQATNIARKMVTEWGMSDKLGPLTYGEPDHEVFLGHSVTQHKNVSNETANVIDSEIRSIVDQSFDTAKKILVKNEKQLHILAKALLEYETLSGDEIKEVISGKTLSRPEENGAKKPKGKKTSAPKKSSMPTSTQKKIPRPIKPEPEPGV